jgi:hypothetical protein
MTKTDYELIARTIKTTNIWQAKAGKHGLDPLEEFTNRLANELARENPKFNRARFLAACGVQHDD